MQQVSNLASVNPSTPFRVTVSEGVRFLVKDANEPFPSTFALLATTAPKKVILRVSGGCSNMGPQDKVEMLQYFADSLVGFLGCIWSGGTRCVNDAGMLDPMVTDVPGVIKELNPNCIALGSAPRTDVMRLVDDSRLTLGGGNHPNPNMSAILIVQNGADRTMDWNGDLDDVFTLMTNLKECANFSEAGIISWNGGGVTKEEILRSAKKGWPTILVRGSGRGTDEYIKLLEAGDEEFLAKLPKNHQMVAVDRSDPQTLRDALIKFGFIDPPVSSC